MKSLNACNKKSSLMERNISLLDAKNWMKANMKEYTYYKKYKTDRLKKIL